MRVMLCLHLQPVSADDELAQPSTLHLGSERKMVLRGTYSALSQNNRGSGGRGPLWVKNGSVRARAARPFYPQVQTSSACPSRSVWCHERKSRLHKLPKEKMPEGGCQFKPDDRGNAGLDYRRYVDPQRSFRMYGHSGKFRVVFDEAPATMARHSKITPFNIAQTALNRLKRTRLRPCRLPGRTARQLPDQSTTLWVESSSTSDPRLRGALPLTDIGCLLDHLVGA